MHGLLADCVPVVLTLAVLIGATAIAGFFDHGHKNSREATKLTA